MNTILNKKCGIWGFGIVGKSVARFLSHHTVPLEIFDQRILTDTEKEFLSKNNIALVSNKEQFLINNDIIIPSPGVNIDSLYACYASKWLCELDLFAQVFSRKIISITGTVGKTSTTKLLSDILKAYNISIVMGGNIGIACLDVIEDEWLLEKSQRKSIIEYAVLEVSSFQLAHTQLFTPDIAIMTNFSPNHLDWHETEEAYFKAKCAQFIRQTADQKAVIPFNLKKQITDAYSLKSKKYFFSITKVSPEELASLDSQETLFYIDNNTIMVFSHNVHEPLISLNQLPRITFDQNWLIICATLYIMNRDIHYLPSITRTLSIPEHRLEKCASVGNVTIYNDSKGTTTTSTLAAIQQLQHYSNPIVLILGGLSKGVDRAPFIAELKNKVKKVYTFGAESEDLARMCIHYTIPVTAHTTLEEVVKASLLYVQDGDQILFSPAGSSYDQFTDYVHRGNYFKELIRNYSKNENNI